VSGSTSPSSCFRSSIAHAPSQTGVSVRGRVSASEADVPDEKLEEYIVGWPGKWPKGSRGGVAPAGKEPAREPHLKGK
jgi:hypothetical protein